MKKLWLFLLVGMLTISGCSGNGKKEVPEDPSKDSQVIEYAKQISTEREVVDAVLMGTYYQLPCPLKEFLDKGWKEDTGSEESKIETIELKPDTVVEISFINDKKSLEEFNAQIDLYLMNDTSDTIKITEETQVIGMVADNFYLASKDFVTKGGIALNAKTEDVNQAFKNFPSYTSDEYEGILEDRNEIDIVNYSFYSKEKIVDKITLLSVDLYDHKGYVDPKMAEESIADFKKECENESAKYLPNRYSQLVTELRGGAYKSVSLYVEGTVGEYIEIGYGELQFAAGSAYVIKDSNGNEYALKTSSLNNFVLSEGDTVQVWTISHEVIQMDEENEVFIPYLTPDIINANGSEIFNHYRSE